MQILTLIETTRLRLLALAQRLSFLAPLLLRVTLGVVFIQTGWGKLSDLAQTAENFRGWGVPLPEINARIASCTEFFGGILLLVGLGTRLAALPMAFTMLVAIATAKRSAIGGFNFDGFTNLLGFEEWSYLVMFLVVAIIGPGRVSVDAFIAQRLARRAHAPGLPSSGAPVRHG